MAEITRRALLGTVGAVAAAGVGAALGLVRPVHHPVPVPPAEPPAALTEALVRQQRLLADYGPAAGLTGRTAGLRAEVAEHGDAIRALLELYPGWRLHPTVPSPVAGASPGLAAGSRAVADALRTTALQWPATEPHAVQVVPVLASIAASLSCHAQVLG